MHAIIVYDSNFGNTEQIAQAIAESLSKYDVVQVISVDRAYDLKLDAIDLLVVGGPTTDHGISQPMRDWLDSLPHDGLKGIVAAAFDTRYHLPTLLSGSAAHGIDKRLRKLGAEVWLPPQSFYVLDQEGPLAEGEIERASRWAFLTPAGVDTASDTPPEA